MLKKTPITGAEAALAELTRRRAVMEQRRDAASAAFALATAQRRLMVTEVDEPTPAQLDKADRACRDAADAEAGAIDVLAAVDARLDEVRITIEQLKANADRERRAAAIEASAKAADAAVERIRKAAGELDSARRDLAAALLPEATACYAPPSNAVDFGPSYLTTALFYDFRGDAMHDTLDADQVAARVVGHLVSGALPGLGIARLEDATKMHAGGGSTHVLAPVDGDVARSLLTDPMRAVAARVRAGDTAAAATVAVKPAQRRQAVVWHTDTEGRSTDGDGRPVDGRGFYLDDAPEAA